jgi:D-glycero-D-manno-heptose 1,7-bisphosphate phosphatase
VSGRREERRCDSKQQPVEGGCADRAAPSAPRRGACDPRQAACPERAAALDSRDCSPPSRDTRPGEGNDPRAFAPSRSHPAGPAEQQGERKLAPSCPHQGRGAAFLDRDGVINDQTAFVNEPADFRLLSGAAAAIRRLNEAGIPVVVVTNQGGIALGYLTEDDLAVIHEHMAELLAAEGARVDAIYYSPYFPNGTIPRYAKESPDRKPGIGMLERARDELGIDLCKSYLVGDATTDILAGNRAGCTTILVQTGQAGTDGKQVAEPNYTAKDLAAAVELILEHLLPQAEH